MFEETIPEAVGALGALGRRVREVEKMARDNPGKFYEQQRQLPYDQTIVAFLIRSVRSLLLILTAGNAILDDLRLLTEAYELAAESPEEEPRPI